MRTHTISYALKNVTIFSLQQRTVYKMSPHTFSP